MFSNQWCNRFKSLLKSKNVDFERLLGQKQGPGSFINNNLISNPPHGDFYPIIDPASLEILTFASDNSKSEEIIQKGIKNCHNQFNSMEWKKVSPKERSAMLSRWGFLMRENSLSLSLLITLENGKPLKESMAEVLYACDYVDFYSSEACRIHGEYYSNSRDPAKRIIVKKEPLGVVGMITPWNFPVAMITRKVAPAIAAGCCVIAKPAHQTPLSMLALAILGREAGFPGGLFNVVSGMNAELVGKVMAHSPMIKKLSFTGSTAVGKLLFNQSSETLKRLSLELGGNAPVIVFEDADIENAVLQIFNCKFRCSGQTCISANRIYVHRQILSQFTTKFLAKVSSPVDIVIGHGTEKDTTLGPLIDEKAIEKVSDLVSGLPASEFKILYGGGKIPSLPGYFFEPTVIMKVTGDSCSDAHPILREEIFGPVALIIPFEDENQVLKSANDTSAGLASYVFTSDLKRSLRIADDLQYGMVGINDCAISDAEAPFGGIKESGFGREGSIHGINEYLYLKYLKING